MAIGAGQRAGQWHAVLRINEDEFKRAIITLRQREDSRWQTLATHGARYSVVVQSYSNIRMAATVEQASFEPGSELAFQAQLAEYDLPVEKRAGVQVELTRPGGTVASFPMTEVEPGVFQTTTKASLSGVYHARVLAQGVSLRGTPFTREQILSAAVWRGGDNPYQPPRDNPQHDDLCRLLGCLLSDKILSDQFEERLKRAGVDLEGIRRCLREYCRRRRSGSGE